MAKKASTPKVQKHPIKEPIAKSTPKLHHSGKKAVASKVEKNPVKPKPKENGKKAVSPKVQKKAAASPKVEKNPPKAAPKLNQDEVKQKKTISLEDSIIKDSKASKLAALLQKQNVKKPVNLDKFANELEWSDDDLSDSDMDSLEEDSEDGLVYAEDGEFEDNESEIDVEDDNDDVEEEKSVSITGDEEEDIEGEENGEEDFEIVTTVTRSGDKSTGAEFEFITQGKIALKSLVGQEKKMSKKLLVAEESSGVYVDVKYKSRALRKMSKLIELPFPERNSGNSSICLILPDLSHNVKDRKDPDVDKQARDWANILLEKYGITGRDVAKIVTLTQLKSLDKQSKRDFVQSYDIVLVDGSMLRSSTQRGGRLLIPFKVTARNVPAQLKKAYRLTQMVLRAGDRNVKIRIGNLTQGNSQLSANFVAVADAILAYTPFGHKNIKTAQIVQNAVELPFYVDDNSNDAEVITISDDDEAPAGRINQTSSRSTNGSNRNGADSNPSQLSNGVSTNGIHSNRPIGVHSSVTEKIIVNEVIEEEVALGLSHFVNSIFLRDSVNTFNPS